MTKPSVLIVPGSFVLPSAYDEVVNVVRGKGIDVKAVHNLSTGLAAGEGRPGAPPSMYDDAANIASHIKELADEGKDVIVLAHSYGGVPATQSVKGLTKQDRQKQGKSGGVARIAYMTCIVPEIGQAAKDVLGEAPPDRTVPMHVGEDGWMSHPDPAATARLCLNTVPPEQGLALVKTFAKHSGPSFAGELTYAGYKDVSVSYALCEEDLCISPDLQEKEIQMIEKESGKQVDVTRMKSDHCPNATAQDAMIAWILDVVEKTVTTATT